MPGLQEAFYIIGIVFMSIMLILVIALISAVFVIRAKVNAIHDQIEDKVRLVTDLASKGGELVSRVKKVKNAVKR